MAPFVKIIFLIVCKYFVETYQIECGVPSYNFTEAENYQREQDLERFEFPWKVGIMDPSSFDSSSRFRCNGVLVDEKTVITTAECIQPISGELVPAREFAVALGAHTMEELETGAYNYAVESYKIHDKWNPHTIPIPNYDGDIAVVKLAGPVTFNEYIRPVCLATKNEADITEGKVAGWTYHDDTIFRRANIPRKVKVSILSDERCKLEDGPLADLLWKESFCAGERNADVCSGDAGSGFYVRKNGKFYLRGILATSVDRPCSETYFSLYADVIEYLDFIRSWMTVKSVRAECFISTWWQPAYECTGESVQITSPNSLINISPIHNVKGKSDIDVQRFIFRHPKFYYLPDANSIAGKFKTVDNLFLNGVMSDSGSFVKLDDTSFGHYAFVRHLTFQNMHLGEFPNRLLHHLPDLITFEANWCGLKTIPFKFFDQNLKLSTVKLNNNAIESLHDENFKNNIKLKRIIIHHNRLKTLLPNLIMNAPFLKDFDTSYNEIKSVHENFRRNNINLNKFKI